MMPNASRHRALRAFVAAGLLLDGLLAGSTVDRFVAGWPAWKHVGVNAWAEYSRHADLPSLSQLAQPSVVARERVSPTCFT